MKKYIFALIASLLFNISFSQALINKEASIVISSSTFVNLKSEGATLNNYANSSITINGAIDIADAIINNGEITIAGSLINFGSVSGSGSEKLALVVENSQMHFISSPVQASPSSVFNGSFAFAFNEEENVWQPLGSNNLEVMQGYSIQAIDNNGFEIIGRVNSGQKSIGISNSKGGWNLVGNPFPSQLDWNSENWNKESIENTIYYWNAENENYSYYGTSSLGGALTVNNGTNIIPAMQGFFVKAKNNGILTVNSEARIHANQPFYKSASIELEQIKLKVKNEHYSDETLIAFNSVAEKSHNSDYDAYKLLSRNLSVPQLFIINEASNEQYAIKVLPVAYSDNLIKLGIRGEINKTYSLELVENTLLQPAFLYDKQLNKFECINDKLNYKFVLLKNEVLDRFFISFSNLVSNSQELIASIKVEIHYNELTINGLNCNLNQHNLSIYDISGRIVYSNNLNSNYYTLPLTFLSKGGYIVKVKNETVQINKNIFVK